MSTIERSALVTFSAQQMFSLVNDIEAYPQFMRGCSAAKILQRGDNWVEAELELQRSGFKQSFVTRNTLDEPHSMTMELIKGPFKKFHGKWEFQALSEQACKVRFVLELAFANPLMGMMLNSVFEQVATEQLQSICERAQQIYGTDTRT